MQEKFGQLIKLYFILQKYFLRTANGPIRILQGHTPLGVTHFWGKLLGTLLGVNVMVFRKREMMLEACLAIGE